MAPPPDHSARFRNWAPVLLTVSGVGWMYAATLKRSLSGCPSEFCVDVGEIQVALATGGTIHHTGYPLYMLIGSPWVGALRLVGVSAAEAAAWYSWATMLVAIGLVVGLYREATGSRWLAAAAAAALAVLPAVWWHGVIPEVYAFHMAFVVGVIWLTFRLRGHWSDNWGWALALLGGLGVAHHRLIAPLLVVSALLLLQDWWKSARRWAWLGWAVALFLAGFLPYLDLPLRAGLGAVWLYDRPDTWAGFWRVFLGSEASDLGQTSLLPGGLSEAARWVFGEIDLELTTPIAVILVIGASASWLSRARRPVVFVLGAFGLGTLVFSLLLYRAVLLAATHMSLFLALIGLAAIGFDEVGARLAGQAPRTRAWLHGAAVVALAAIASARGVASYAEISALTADDRYSRLVRTTVAHLRAPAGSVLMEPWGQPYFALAYHRLVDQGLVDVTLVDHRADLAALADGGSVYTLATTLNVFGLDWWRERLGPDVNINSAGGGWVAIGPPLAPPAGAREIVFGDGIALIDVVVTPLDTDSVLNVQVDWLANGQPTADYSTYVHASDLVTDDITDPGHLIAQSDSQAPVFGRVPTTQWQPGALVREDHALAVAPGPQPQALFIGMYRQAPDGQFVRLGQARWVLTNGLWIQR